MAQQTNKKTGTCFEPLRSDMADDTRLLEALFSGLQGRPEALTSRDLATGTNSMRQDQALLREQQEARGGRCTFEAVHEKGEDAIVRRKHQRSLRHLEFMRCYRQRREYRRSDRAYNVVEYLVRCLRAGREANECILRLVGVCSLAEFRQKWEETTGRNLDLTSYGETWFFAHKKPIRNFDLSDLDQFRECVSVKNLARGHIAKPWRNLRKKLRDESPLLPGMSKIHENGSKKMLNNM